jgi:hypothetical protein
LLCLRVISIHQALVTNDNPGQEVCIIGGDLTKLLIKSHQARYMTPNKRILKIIMSTQLHEILYTDSQNMLVLLYKIASRYCTAVQVAAPVPEVTD